MNAEEPGRRPLLPPLTREHSIPLPGRGWQEREKIDDVIAGLDVGETGSKEPKRVVDISSIPSPWARLLLFRDGIAGQTKHPFYQEALSDILDTLEILFISKVSSYTLEFLNVNLTGDNIHVGQGDKIHNLFVRDQKLFSKALQDQCPKELESITLVLITPQGSETNVLAGTSPYTLFFTPEQKKFTLSGYYEYPKRRESIFKKASQRNALFIEYLKDDLTPSLVEQYGNLKKCLDEYLQTAPSGHNVYSSKITKESIQELPILQRLDPVTFTIESNQKIRPSKTDKQSEKLPLILTEYTTGEYFAGCDIPQPFVVGKSLDRDYLPMKEIKYPWIYPYSDFLEDILIRLPYPLANQGEHDYFFDGRQKNFTPYLLPLKPTYFKYFKPEDAENYLSIGEDPTGNIIVELIIPIGQNNEKTRVRKIYRKSSIDEMSKGTHLALWPRFRCGGWDGFKRWEDYFLIHSETTGREVERICDIEFYDSDGNETESTKSASKSASRDHNTRLLHSTLAPVIIRITRNRQKHVDIPQYISESSENIDKWGGILLPNFHNFKEEDFDVNKGCIVGVDFGTSNTIIGIRYDSKEPSTLVLSESHFLDFQHSEYPEWDNALAYYFIPKEYRDPFFATHINYLSTIKSDSKRILLDGNIPFKRKVAYEGLNKIQTDLKWSAGAHIERLTTLFLGEIFLLLKAELIKERVNPDSVNVKYKWSYPISFGENRWNSVDSIWREILPNSVSVDESTCGKIFCSKLKGFNTNTKTPKITIDIGGGTTDVSAYKQSSILFRDSILLGGRDLVGDRDFLLSWKNPFVAKLLEFAEQQGSPEVKDVIVTKLEDSHSKFTYFISSGGFEKIHTKIVQQEFFNDFRISVLYFFSAIMYYIGLYLRRGKEKKAMLPDMLMFAGNGSKYLDWLTALNPWEKSRKTEITQFLRKMVVNGSQSLEESIDIKFQVSPYPKQEVALGLVYDDPDNMNVQPKTLQAKALLGEAIKISAKEMDEWQSTSDNPFTEENKSFSYLKDFQETAISKFNSSFIETLDTIEHSRKSKQKMKGILHGVKQNELLNHVMQRLTHLLQREQKYEGSLFILEVTVCLDFLLEGISDA